MEMFWGNANEKRHEQVGVRRALQATAAARAAAISARGRRVVVAVGEGSGVVVDRGGRHGEAVIMRRIVDRASPSSV